MVGSRPAMKRKKKFLPMIMLWIETHQLWASSVMYQSLTPTVAQIAYSVNLHYRLMKTCIKWSKRRDQYLVNNRETIKNDKRNPLHIFSTKIIQCSWASWGVKKAKQNYLLRIFRAHRVLTHKVFLPLSLKTPSTEKGIISVLRANAQKNRANRGHSSKPNLPSF